MATAREDCPLQPMVESEMRDVVRYEDNLAACYEAEYLLSLKMQEEMGSREYGKYDYYDESELVTDFLQPGASQSGSEALHGNGVSAFTRTSCRPSYGSGCLEVAEDCIMDCTSGLSLPMSNYGVCATDCVTGVCKAPLSSRQTLDRVVVPLADSMFKSSNGLGSQSHVFSTSGHTPSLCGGPDFTGPGVLEGNHLDGPIRKKARYNYTPEC